MPGIQNPAIAQVVAQLAKGADQPVPDAVLRTAVSPYKYDRFGGNFESIPGPPGDGQVHPRAGVGPSLSMGQSPLMAVTPGGGPSTQPGPKEGRDFGGPRVSHTLDEKGMGVLTTNPEAVQDMLMSMGLPTPMIQQVMKEMGYGY